MSKLLEVIEIFLGIVLFGITGMIFLVICLKSVIYIVGYIYDCIGEKLLFYVTHLKLKKNEDLKIKVSLNKYIRYNTPLFTYCFSFIPIMILVCNLPIDVKVTQIIKMSLVYLLIYFVGMYRAYGKDRLDYKKILKHNISFLKLSFLPLGFCITVFGFYFTVSGTDAHEIPVMIKDMICNMIEAYRGEKDIINGVLYLVKLEGILLIVNYFICLPMQAVAYFVISIIKYLGKHKAGYIEMFKDEYKIINKFTHLKIKNLIWTI